MQIAVYDEVDPVKVLELNLLALDFALTPEHAANIRQTDPRPFPFFAVYAVEQAQVLGQVGVFRLPMISKTGREDVGGVWAVSTHPHFAGRGVASLLLDEAHKRMREAGLRFSTLGTNRYRVAYQLYKQHGYEETNVLATALARWETAHQPTRLHAEPAGVDGYDRVEQIFSEIAKSYLGFAWRHTPFARLRRVDVADIWLLCENARAVGYALAHADQAMLTITNLALAPGVDAAEAVAAVAAVMKVAYVKVKISRPAEVASLRRAGYSVANPTWGGFMIKPLVPEVNFEEAQRLYGIGTDQFLISWLDMT